MLWRNGHRRDVSTLLKWMSVMRKAILYWLGPLIIAAATSIVVPARADEICICGYNPYLYCDGSYEHYVSECYTELNNFCGYDDQLTGPCDNLTARKKAKSEDLYVVTRPVFPKRLFNSNAAKDRPSQPDK